MADEAKKDGKKAEAPKETFEQSIERGANEAAERWGASLTGAQRADYLVLVDYLRMKNSALYRAGATMAKMGQYLALKGQSAEFDYFCKTGKIGTEDPAPKAEPKDA